MVPEMGEQPVREMTKMFRMLEKTIQVSLEGLPYEEWLNRLQVENDDDPLRPLLPMFEEKVYDGRCQWEMYENMPISDTENLRQYLQDVPELATCPFLDQDIFKKFLSSLGLALLCSNSMRVRIQLIGRRLWIARDIPHWPYLI